MSFSNPLLTRLKTIFVDDPVTPKRGSIVYRKLGPAEHTGIYVGHQKIIQLSGSGLVECVDFQRFCADNPFNQMYVACDTQGYVLAQEEIARRAERQLGSRREYNVIFNNCHQFCAGCMSGDFENPNNFFVFLEHELEKQFQEKLSWRYMESPWN